MITSKGKRWELLHSLWLGWVVLTFGLLSWVALVYIGIRARHRKWVLWGLVYAAITLLVSSDAGSNNTGLFLFLAAWVISSIHAFRSRKEYLMRLEALQRGGGVTDATLRPQRDIEYSDPAQTSSSQSPTQRADIASRPDFLGPTVSSEQPVTIHDVSEVNVLRKRLGRAAFSMKVIGLLSAVNVFFFFAIGWASIFLLALPLGLLVFWCAVRLSKRLRAGDTSAAMLIAVWWLLWIVVNLFDILPKSLGNENNDFDIYSAIGIAIYNLPIYFVARGVLALRAYERRLKGGAGEVEPLASNPWEGGGEKMERHPAFVNKRSLALYPLLLLVPLPWIFAQISGRMQDSPMYSAQNTQAFVLGQQLGFTIGLLAIWLSLTVFLYRRARRRALLPAVELSKRNPRPPILYLRSFLDDQIKMRARAANGRSFLERVVKITFEEVITDHLWRYGPVVAIGKPGDKVPPLGAARDYVSDGSWRQKVEQLMAQSSIIVVVVGRTEGLSWELNKIIELGLTRKLVLLLPPTRVGDLPARWNILCERASEVGLMLPQDIDLRRIRAVVLLPGQGVHTIAADEDNDWAYETVLDAAAELIRPPDHRYESAANTGSEQQNIGAERYSTQ